MITLKKRSPQSGGLFLSCCLLKKWLAHTTVPEIKNAARAEIDSCVRLQSSVIGNKNKEPNRPGCLRYRKPRIYKIAQQRQSVKPRRAAKYNISDTSTANLKNGAYLVELQNARMI